MDAQEAVSLQYSAVDAPSPLRIHGIGTTEYSAGTDNALVRDGDEDMVWCTDHGYLSCSYTKIIQAVAQSSHPGQGPSGREGNAGVIGIDPDGSVGYDAVQRVEIGEDIALGDIQWREDGCVGHAGQQM